MASLEGNNLVAFKSQYIWEEGLCWEGPCKKGGLCWEGPCKRGTTVLSIYVKCLINNEIDVFFLYKYDFCHSQFFPQKQYILYAFVLLLLLNRKLLGIIHCVIQPKYIQTDHTTNLVTTNETSHAWLNRSWYRMDGKMFHHKYWNKGG